MSIVAPEEFIGINKISQNSFDKIELQKYIDYYEKYYMVRLLGSDLYSLLLADLDVNNEPQSPIYESIFNEFTIDDNYCVIHSDGIKYMLLGFIRFRYGLDKQLAVTPVGITRNLNENSEHVTSWSTPLHNSYNTSIDTYKSIQYYINDHIEDYPNYNGQCLKYSIPFF